MLTSLKIDRLKSDTKSKRYADRDGLTLEVRPNGKKIFLFRYQWEKKPQTITLGHYPALSLKDARGITVSYRTYLHQGTDPRDILKPQIESEKVITLKMASEQWYEKNKHGWRIRTQTLHLRSLTRDIYPYIGNIDLNKLTKSDLLSVIHPHEALGHHEIAHRLYDRLKAIYDFAVAAGLTDNYPFIGLKKALAPKPRIKNQVAISPDEAHEMIKKIKGGKAHKIIKLYIEILSHLFVRPSELRLAKWTEFNLNLGEWNIPTDRMKMDAPHWVPLSSEVLGLLKELRLITGFTPYLFASPSTKNSQPISEASARKLLHKSGYKGRHTLHGFRALASSLLHEQSSFRTDAIEAQLAHKVQGVRGVYLRADFKKERRELMGWYSKWLVGDSKKLCLSTYN